MSNLYVDIIQPFTTSGSLTLISASFTGSLQGTASFATSASFATTASFALNVTPLNTGSFITTASITNATTTFTKGDGSTFALTTNNVVNADSASVAANATSASFASTATSASYALTASFALNAGTTVSTASLLTTASATNNVITFTKGDASTFNVTVATGSGGSAFPFTGSAVITGSLTVIGTVIGGNTSNVASGTDSATFGGNGGANSSTNTNSFIAGANASSNAGVRSAIVGGGTNTITGTQNNFIGGGRDNTISGSSFQNTIIGGQNNVVNGIGTTSGVVLAGGYGNTIAGNGIQSAGIYNGYESVIRNTTLFGTDRRSYSVIAGGANNKMHSGTNTGGEGTNVASVILGGQDNNLLGNYANSTTNYNVGILLSLGSTIMSSSNRSVIIGGENNLINGSTNSVILGGSNITASVSNTVYVPNLVVTGSSILNGLTISGSSTDGGLLSMEPWSTLPAAASYANTFAVSGSKPYFSDGSTWNALF